MGRDSFSGWLRDRVVGVITLSVDENMEVGAMVIGVIFCRLLAAGLLVREHGELRLR
jgi:hypothetical protein